MVPIKFPDYKERIAEAIQKKLREIPILDEDGFTLVGGFIMQPLSKEVLGNVDNDGQTIPLVAIVGNTSGRMYYFALKALNISGLEI